MLLDEIEEALLLKGLEQEILILFSADLHICSATTSNLVISLSEVCATLMRKRAYHNLRLYY